MLDIEAFKRIKECESRHQHVCNFCELFKAAGAQGMVLEFGVFQGRSLGWIAECLKTKTAYGFDTFTGLPEDWDYSERPGAKKFPVGHFDTTVLGIGPMPGNVKLVKGLFQDTLPGFLASHPGPVGLVHVDSDLYSSAAYVLEALNDRIVPGTVVAFDELFDMHRQDALIYDRWREGEWKAMNEWIDRHGRVVEPVLRTAEFQGVVRVLK
jgi:hypothetical protein